MSSEPTTIEFDPFSPTYFDDPYDLYRRMLVERLVWFWSNHFCVSADS